MDRQVEGRDNAGFRAFNAVRPVRPESGRRFTIVTNEFATDLGAPIQNLSAV